MVRKTKENIWIPILTWSGLKTRDVSLVLLSSAKGLGLGLKATNPFKPLPSKTLIIVFLDNFYFTTFKFRQHHTILVLPFSVSPSYLKSQLFFFLQIFVLCIELNNHTCSISPGLYYSRVKLKNFSYVRGQVKSINPTRMDFECV